MNLTHFSDYSLRVLLYLANRSEGLCTIDEISERFKIPRTHLVKVVHQLSRQGLIQSFRGKKGGIRLARDPKSYRIGEIIRSTEPHLHLVECFDQKKNTCPISGSCELETILYEARQVFFEALDRFTLADLLKKTSATRFHKILSQF